MPLTGRILRGHFRLESATEDGEAKRDDEKFCLCGCLEYKGNNANPELHKEELCLRILNCHNAVINKLKRVLKVHKVES